MRFVIVGGGADGSHLAERLIAEGEDVALVEADADRAALLRDRLDAQVIQGNGANPSVLRRAGVQRADILFDVKSSHHLADRIRSLSGRPVLCPTGHSLLKAKARETGAPLAGSPRLEASVKAPPTARLATR